jgi:hypothetical protein
MSTNNSTPIFSEGNPKPIGKVLGDCFYKSIKGSRHMLRKPQAIAISLDALMQAESAGAVYVEVLDHETGTRYQTSLEHIRKAGFAFERGYGRQIGLPLECWATLRPGAPRQLSLLAGA